MKQLINEEITRKYRSVTLVGFGKGEEQKPTIMAAHKALKLAKESDLDLVLVSFKSNEGKKAEVICKILDHKKYLYNKKKNAKASPKNVLKEVKLGKLDVDTNDLKRFAKQASKFVEKYGQVKMTVGFKGGRGTKRKGEGPMVLKRALEEMQVHALTHYYGFVSSPSQGGRQWSVTIKKTKQKVKKSDEGT